ncbi:hypothetical protein V865_006194 [Kwoniella europaea PYCC6329]|uniref:CRIB domain-containing protein n=1 Tax=Kwoniella europaea PYCC6329 TaxID=1423913 RepID=A0AAX4KQ45_9TREE
MSRPGTFRSKSSDKALPSLPADGLGLDFSGLPRSPAPSSTVGLGLELELNPKSSKPPPTHFIPLRQSPTTIYTSNIPPVSSPSIISSSPSTPIASSSISISGYPFPYGNEHYSNSTSTVINLNTSTTTLTQLARPPDSPSISISTSPPDISSSFTPKQKKVGFGQAESIRSENVILSSSTSSTSTTLSGQKPDVPLGRKRSSGQLLMGIGKGLNRVGSVMRRNTESNVHNTSPNKKGNARGGSKWRNGRRRKTNDWQDAWEKVDRIGEEGDEGDVGIGRPFNVGHDLHVSPDLSDLPEQWLSSLKAQGLTESDLILISAARKKQHETHRLPLRTTSRLPQAPLSAPPSRLLDGPCREMIAGPSSEDAHQMGSSGLLKKFSFEDRSPTTPTQAGTSSEYVVGPSQMTCSPTETPNQNRLPSEILQTTPNKHDRRRAIESFPVSAAGSSDLNHNHNLEAEDVFSPHRNSTISALPGEKTNFTVPIRRNKRFSSQLKGFRESTFGLGEEDEGEWGKSVLDSTWLSSSAKEKGKMRDDKIPVPPEPLLPSSQAQINSGESGYRTPSSHDPIQEVVMPKSPPPPARPRKQPSVTLVPIPDQDTSQIPKEDEGSELEIESRKSSESFGVHYNTSMAKSKSSVSVGSELITPSTSMEQGMAMMVREKGDSDEGHEHEHGGQGECTFGLIKEITNTDICDQPTELISREGFITRYHSNPHISLPASAIHSRSTTPHSIPKLKPNLAHQHSYSTFDSSPYKVLEEDDLMDGLDRANPEERASIALSILSSRTSASMQSLHELSQATVRTAYKLPPVGEVSPITTLSTSNPFINTITTNKYTNNNGNENENDKNNDDNENNDEDNNTNTNRGSSGGLKLIDESSECGSISLVSTSGWGSEENDGEGEAKDAMDALGEAARRLRSS